MDLLANPTIDPQVAIPGSGPIFDRITTQGIKVHVVPFGDIEKVHRPFTLRKGIGATTSAIRAVRLLLRICKSQKIDVLHSNGLKAHVISAAFGYLAGQLLILYAIRDIPHTRTERILWMALRHIADHLILVSKACWPLPQLPANATVIHNGIDLPRVKLRPFRPIIPLKIGFIGRIDMAKGLHLLLGWMNQARSNGLELILVVRGRFDSTDANYKNQITDFISSSGLQECVRFDGFVSNPGNVYSDLDLVCVPSHVPDPLPRSVMEPMARGIPVIAYPAGGILEMIDDLKTGFLVSNANQFIQAIRSLQMDGGLIDRMIVAARSKIQTEFSLGLLYAKCNAIYADASPHASSSEEFR